MLAIENCGHGYHDVPKHVIEQVVIKHRISSKQIILRSESADMLAAVEFWCNKYGIEFFETHWMTAFENMYSWHAKDVADMVQPNLAKTEKLYLSFNGLFRVHRAGILLLLHERNLLDIGAISYATKPTVPSGEETISSLLWNFDQDPEFAATIDRNRAWIRDLQPIYLDKDQSRLSPQVHVNEEFLDTNHLYRQTLFSLVTETSFPYGPRDRYNDTQCIMSPGRILSEKIFKPILHKHPFVLVSNPHTLPLLHRRGYQTFHPYIDESYDTQEDNARRLCMIADEIKRLSMLTDEELSEWQSNVNEICEHNFTTLANSQDWYMPLPFDQSP